MAASDSPGAERARQQSERFRESMERIRGRTESGSKILGTVATGAIGAIGYQKLGDVFPYHGPFWAPFAIGFGALAMIVAAALLIYRFRRASWSIATSSDYKQTVADNDLDLAEQASLRDAYDAVAHVNEARTLAELEDRGRRLERCAEQENGEKAATFAKQADRILTEVQLAQDRAGTFILRRRATRALFSFAAAAYVFLFVLGWYGLALGADAMESKRNDEVELVKKCGEARKAVGFADVELPSACRGAEAPSGEEIAAGAKAALADAKKACRQAAKGGNGDEAECDSLVLAKPETETE